MTASLPARSKVRFVPTLTEVITPLVLERAVMMPNGSDLQNAIAAVGSETVSPLPPETVVSVERDGATHDEAMVARAGSALDATVESLLPQALAELRVALQASADRLVEQQLVAFEQQLRTRLRSSVRHAMGLAQRNRD